MVQFKEAHSLLTDIRRFPEFCKNYIKIRSKKGGLVPFELNKIQLYVFNKYIKKPYLAKEPIVFLLLKSRQFGGSTLMMALIFWLTLGHPNYSSAVIGTKSKQAATLFRMLKTMNNNSPWGQRPPDTSLFPFFIQRGDSNTTVEFGEKSKVHHSRMHRELNDYGLNKSDIMVLNSMVEIKSAEEGDDLGRAGTYQAVLASEVAKWERINVSLGAIKSCCHPLPETVFVLESTANGMNEFYHLWMNMRFGEDDVPSFWQKCFIPWYWDSEYELDVPVKKEFIDDYEEELFDRILTDGKYSRHIEKITKERVWNKIFWRRMAIRDLKSGDLDKFNEDYPSTPAEAFISSGKSIFHQGQLREMASRARSPIWKGHVFSSEEPGGLATFEPHPRGRFKIFEHEQPNHRYIIFADVAEGKATEGTQLDEEHSKYDFSCAQVLCATSYPPAMKQVAVWHGNCDPDMFGGILVGIALKYNKGLLVWESNNQGRGVGFHITHKLGYKNIYMRRCYDDISRNQTTKPGWQTTSRTKHDMVVTAIRMVREGEVDLVDDATIVEAQSYTQLDSRTYASSSGHDDRIDALMGCLVIADPLLTFWRRKYESERRENNKLKGTPEEMSIVTFEEDELNNPYLGDDF